MGLFWYEFTANSGILRFPQINVKSVTQLARTVTNGRRLLGVYPPEENNGIE